jgi:transposase-like protein
LEEGRWCGSTGSSTRTSRPARSGWCSRPGKPIAEVARDLGINEGTLGNWVNIWRRENPEPTPELTPVERARVKKMEDEIRRLRMENEFLKKAAAFFARTQP